jgi:hypothetical protein
LDAHGREERHFRLHVHVSSDDERDPAGELIPTE